MTPPHFSDPPRQPQKSSSKRFGPLIVIALALSAILIVTGVILYILQQNAPGQGIIGPLKHFPGTGRIDQADDPHSTLPTVSGVSEDDYYNTDREASVQGQQSHPLLQNSLSHLGKGPG